MNNELYHYGVLGMKWGVRRYQNPDGTLTPAGRRHKQQTSKSGLDTAAKIASPLLYATVKGAKNRRQKQQEEYDSKPHYNVSAKETHKNMDQMTDAELQRAINRINMQNQVAAMDKSAVQRGMDSLGRRNKQNTQILADGIKTINVVKALGKLL